MSSKHAKISKGITFKGVTANPTDPDSGDLIYRSDLSQLLLYQNAQWNQVNGVTGVQGATGAGIQGATGLQGAVGIQGDTGVQGLVGATGIQGIQGIQGATGVIGLQGLTGLIGATGIDGVQGLTGVGIQGATGVAAAAAAYTRGATTLVNVATDVDTIGNLPALVGDGIGSELDYSVAMTNTGAAVKYQVGKIIAWKGDGTNWDYSHSYNIAVDIGFRLSITAAGVIQYIAPTATIGSVTSLKIRTIK